jgi:4'-phosphopantetheinyl transferase
MTFGVTPRGKPHLVNPSIDLRFNLSHSGDMALVALALGREVGVDIEHERPVEYLKLARRSFAPAEADALERMPPSAHATTFFQCWARKEAFIKALGEGLSYPLDGFEVSLTDDDFEPRILRQDRDGASARRWRIRAWPLLGYAAAVAAEGVDWTLTRHA